MKLPPRTPKVPNVRGQFTRRLETSQNSTQADSCELIRLNRSTLSGISTTEDDSKRDPCQTSLFQTTMSGLDHLQTNPSTTAGTSSIKRSYSRLGSHHQKRMTQPHFIPNEEQWLKIQTEVATIAAKAQIQIEAQVQVKVEEETKLKERVKKLEGAFIRGIERQQTVSEVDVMQKQVADLEFENMVYEEQHLLNQEDYAQMEELVSELQAIEALEKKVRRLGCDPDTVVRKNKKRREVIQQIEQEAVTNQLIQLSKKIEEQDKQLKTMKREITQVFGDLEDVSMQTLRAVLCREKWLRKLPLDQLAELSQLQSQETTLHDLVIRCHGENERAQISLMTNLNFRVEPLVDLVQEMHNISSQDNQARRCETLRQARVSQALHDDDCY